MPNTPVFIGMSVTPTMEVPVDKLPPSGVRGSIHVVPIRPGESKPDQARLQDRSVRKFVASALLGKSPPSNERISGDFTEVDGASHLTTDEDAYALKCYTHDGEFFIKKNEAGDLSLVSFECAETNEVQCRERFLKIVTPTLDRISYTANVPLFIHFVRAVDTKHDVTTMEYVSPYRRMAVQPHAHQFPIEMMPIYAMYREAKNANSDFYRFLCYYKILEGLFKKMRTDLYARAKQAGISLVHQKLAVPYHPEIHEKFQKSVGQPMKVFFDHVLTKQFRDAVAHFRLDSGSILNMSDPKHMDAYSNLTLVCELCVRSAIENHESLLAQIPT